MYCPYCSSIIQVLANGEGQCERSQALLSRNVVRRLRECFVDQISEPSAEPLPYDIGGKWFCPGCGIQMRVEDRSATCPTCGRCLNEFVREIVELNPHVGC
jgi:rubrerythrin